jgi:hypothetical protein
MERKVTLPNSRKLVLLKNKYLKLEAFRLKKQIIFLKGMKML